MSASSLDFSFSSTPYTQHHTQNPNPFTQTDTQSHIFTPYERMIKRYLNGKLLNLGASIGSTRINNFKKNIIDTGNTMGPATINITADQLLSQYILVTGSHTGTISFILPEPALVLEKFKEKFGMLRAGMTIPVLIKNDSNKIVLENPLLSSDIMIGTPLPPARVLSTKTSQYAFIRIPSNDATTYEFVNTQSFKSIDP
tara:strand:+ start:2627 stop:3223 length:597 start_codon:yes stop_codon:yes gene_type:complete